MPVQPAHTVVHAEEAHHPNHPDKGGASMTNNVAELKGYEAR